MLCAGRYLQDIFRLLCSIGSHITVVPMLKKLSFSKRKTVIEGNILTRSCTEPAFADAENLVVYVHLTTAIIISMFIKNLFMAVKPIEKNA